MQVSCVAAETGENPMTKPEKEGCFLIKRNLIPAYWTITVRNFVHGLDFIPDSALA